MTYSATLSSGASIPGFITLDGTSRKVTVSTSEPKNAGVYNIKVKAAVTWMPSQFDDGFLTWTLTVIAPPAFASSPNS